MKRTWTNEQLKLLTEKYPEATRDELLKLFPDKTFQAVRSKAKYLGIRRAKQPFRFTDEQRAELLRDYATVPSPALARRYGCDLHSIYRFASRYGLKKSVEVIAEQARINMLQNEGFLRTQFKKGRISETKGKKQTEFMSPEAIERTKATRFKTGNLPHNTKFDNAITIRAGYKYIRLSMCKWELYNRYIWEQTYGKIPAGYNVQFKDGNPMNCEIENLYMISRSEQIKNENSLYARYPKEVQQLIHLKGALSRQLNKYKENVCDRKIKGNGE
jgi:hypothetical protein